MELSTERLKIIPLTLNQFKLLLDGIDKMEKELKLSASNECLDGHTQEAMEGLYQEAVKNRDRYFWYTNWQIILKSENKAIGSACFMKCPDENGEVEIGYGINSTYQNNGYMTEAAQAICEWAISQHDVSIIIAETEKDNIASHRVLQKCGMEKYKETDEGIWWRMKGAE
ncbi:GNAT family N-acetyltransferase [Clostridium sp. CM027]|uniref:GNAT family N-acetyltransferase n=1 Tax=Clostridium sp. CM027 TaxID=2849865 RepID=UPI001C6DEF07|nr:GNAT family N-acetyltransferase [Clostridium sp. CM027]MBW9144008.1 GNAT family N-acetyltransferase [Clostridium sp. CM027]UVE41337.1 GNAT family N-acetyltransferase [Clostridium sp. CM027]